jgi:GrpB-like predicted nucleotidyltransferase (UPF0157 family)
MSVHLVLRTDGAQALGLRVGDVELADSDPGWALVFERLAAGLERALPGTEVEHVGSTAVAGLRAKPIVDVAVGVPPPLHEERLTARLTPLGLECRGDSDGGILFVLEDRPEHRVAHVHVVVHGGAEWAAYLAFRDRLRRDPAARTAYEQLKQALARRFPHDRRSYTAGKEAFIERLLADERPRARTARQLRERIQSPPTV